MAEWPKAHDWKSCIPLKGIEGSNPSLSAINKKNAQKWAFFLLIKADKGFEPSKRGFDKEAEAHGGVPVPSGTADAAAQIFYKKSSQSQSILPQSGRTIRPRTMAFSSYQSTSYTKKATARVVFSVYGALWAIVLR